MNRVRRVAYLLMRLIRRWAYGTERGIALLQEEIKEATKRIYEKLMEEERRIYLEGNATRGKGFLEAYPAIRHYGEGKL